MKVPVLLASAELEGVNAAIAVRTEGVDSARIAGRGLVVELRAVTLNEKADPAVAEAWHLQPGEVVAVLR